LKELGADGRIILIWILKYRRTPLIQINWDGEPSGCEEIRIIGFFFEIGLHWQLEVDKNIQWAVLGCMLYVLIIH
jgi:hypothetical protein